jgi:hypothetical protein
MPIRGPDRTPIDMKIAQSLGWRMIELKKLSMRMTTLLQRRRQPSVLPTPRKATYAQNWRRLTICWQSRSNTHHGQTPECIG